MGDASNDDRGEIPESERAALRRRISELDSRLGKAKGQPVSAERSGGQARGSSSRTTGRGMAIGMQMASEFVAAIVVGAAIGFGLDYAIGLSPIGIRTSPWLLILFVLLGFAAGVVNLLRSYKRLQDDINRDTGGRIGQDLTDTDNEDDQ